MISLLLIFLISSVGFCHEEMLEEIDVVEQKEDQIRLDFTQSSKQISNAKLQKNRQTSLGDTLSQESGIQSSSFGPNSSRPVLRGFDGDRIKIIQNGLGILDASAQSADHAVAIDVLSLDQVEIIKGPMSLIYGPSVASGVVNLTTNRIHRVYERGFFAKALSQGETVNNGLSSAVHLNYGTKPWMFHADFSTRNLGDQRIPGHARSSLERMNNPTENEKKGILRNSFNQQDNYGFASTRFFNRGFVGVSFTGFDSTYGTVVEKDVSINMRQNRVEALAEIKPEEGLWKKYKLSFANTDYIHREYEENITGTRFKNSGFETRLEAYNQRSSISGLFGVSVQSNQFLANGVEAFLPSTDIQKKSLFSFQQYSFGSHALRWSGRWENYDADKRQSSSLGAGQNKAFNTWGSALGHCFDFSRESTLETSYSYTERAPNFQELFAQGEHVALGIIERGDSDLVSEKSHSLDVTWKREDDYSKFKLSFFTQLFKDYILLAPTGLNFNGVDEYSYRQTDTLFYGVDLDHRAFVMNFRKGSIFLNPKMDYVFARDTDSGQSLPRISPARISLGLDYEYDNLLFDIDHEYVADQHSIAKYETSTRGYFLTHLGLKYKLLRSMSSYEFFARIRNVFDVLARNHVSPIKDLAPLPGRNFILGVQAQF